jgi:hypothetical protein
MRNDERCIDRAARKDIEIVERRKTSRSPMQLFFLCVDNIAPCRIRFCFMTLLVLSFITRSSWSNNSSGFSEWKRTFSNSNVKDDIPHQGKNFQTKSIIGAIEDDILLKLEKGGYMKSWVRSY